ncbi:MAG: hypothetical protein ACI8ZN_001369 [Bacteroidia bacterium]|jgi:hypothetical protein
MNNWNDLPGSARVWVYGANRALSANEITQISQKLEVFCAEWTAHGTKLKAGFELAYNRFIVLSADEEVAAASGCSIDSSVKVIKELDQELELDLFNRLRIYQIDDENATAMTMNEVKADIEKGLINDSTLIINTLVQTKGDYQNSFVVPISKTWVGQKLRMFV